MKLSVNLLTYNGAKYLPHLFKSLRQQTFHDWQLLILDNGSTDNTVELIKKELENFGQPWQLEINKDNVGFARGHNRLITNNQLPITNYVLLLNQDVVLAPDYFEKLVAFMETNLQVGAAQGMLLRWNLKDDSGIMNQESGERADIIDTLGLKVFKNRRVVDWMAGRPPLNLPLNKGEKEGIIEVFGVSGALPMYRRSALEEIKINGEVFDEDFVSYKEDVDLAFRLRSAGWQAYLLPSARTWHDRTAAGSSTLDDKSAAKNRGKKSAAINYHSYKNHLFVLIKNEYSANLLMDWPWILWYELKKFVYIGLFEHKNLTSIKDFYNLLPRMLAKRKIIISKRKLFAREMRKWFVNENIRTRKQGNKNV